MPDFAFICGKPLALGYTNGGATALLDWNLIQISDPVTLLPMTAQNKRGARRGEAASRSRSQRRRTLARGPPRVSNVQSPNDSRP